MHRLHFVIIVLAATSAVTATPALSWGKRAHAVIDRAALAALPVDGPVFLQMQADYIAASAVMPDSWRGASEPFSKIEEDPNHGWFKEQFAFLKTIPRSRYAFILALHDEYLRIKDSDPARASRTNVRWTGTLPYAVMESYGRLVVCMREVRAGTGDARRFAEQTCAYETARLGHYLGDGAQPLHDSVNSDGWRGKNPHGYTTDPTIHSRFESKLVEAMALAPADLAPRIAAPAHASGDLFNAVLAYLDAGAAKMETVYQLERRSGFRDAHEQGARDLIYTQTATAASMLRDMLCRAWAESAQPPARIEPSPIDPTNPAYDPATGSAPPATD
jgi:hypothetical protein